MAHEPSSFARRRTIGDYPSVEPAIRLKKTPIPAIVGGGAGECRLREERSNEIQP
jgi:hypothetical protein